MAAWVSILAQIFSDFLSIAPSYNSEHMNRNSFFIYWKFKRISVDGEAYWACWFNV